MSNVPEKPNAPTPARSMAEVLAKLYELERRTLGPARKPDRTSHAGNAARSMAEIMARIDKLQRENDCLRYGSKAVRRLDELRAVAAKAEGYKTWAAFKRAQSRTPR